MRVHSAFDSQGLSTLLETDATGLHRACAVVAEAMSMRRETPDQWLADVCESLAGLDMPPLAASALVYAPIDVAPYRRVIHAAVAGLLDKRAASTFLAEARSGMPSDDLLVRQQRDVGRVAAAVRRDEIVDDADWIDARLLRFRASVGLHDFARALYPFRAVEGRRVLALQIDALDPDSPPEDELVEVFNAVAPYVFKGFYRAFVGLPLLQDRLLKMVTPAQRLIVPLLAEGCSESEIADRLDRSRHTIHDHTKAIYKAWGINSRFELRDIWSGAESHPEPVR